MGGPLRGPSSKVRGLQVIGGVSFLVAGSGMKKRRVIGFFTVLAGLPGLAMPLLPFLGLDLSWFVLVMGSLAFALRGVAGTVGGVLLWRGSRRGYQLTAVCWTYLVLFGIAAIVHLFTSGQLGVPFVFEPENRWVWREISKSLGKLIWGAPIVYVLLRDLRPQAESARKLTSA